MAWIGEGIRFFQRWVAQSQVLALILVVDVVAYFAGLLYWYGPVMSNSATPPWAWPFIPDCPLFGLLGGIGLLMVTAQQTWSVEAQARGRRWLWTAAALSVVIWLSTYLPGVPRGWSGQAAMWAVWSWVLLIAALYFRQAPSWLLGLFAFGQIKYGIWTITAWLLYWRSTAAAFGAPHFSFDSVFMTATHIGLVAQGLFLLTYFRPTLGAALVSFGWFALSDIMDYGLGFYPAIPEQYISLTVLQWSTVAVTFLLTGVYLLSAWGRAGDAQAEPGREGASTYA